MRECCYFLTYFFIFTTGRDATAVFCRRRYVSIRSSVCLSVCLSQAGIVSKRLDESSWVLACKRHTGFRQKPVTSSTKDWLKTLKRPRYTVRQAILTCARQAGQIQRKLLHQTRVYRCSPIKRSGGRLKQDLDKDFLNNLGLHTRTLIHVRKIATADLRSCPAIQLLVFECL